MKFYFQLLQKASISKEIKCRTFWNSILCRIASRLRMNECNISTFCIVILVARLKKTFWISQTCSFSVMVCSLAWYLGYFRRGEDTYFGHCDALSVDRDISITASCCLNERKPSNMENFILTLLICLTSIPNICFSLGCYNCVTRNK